jgi:hypothetical protein
LANLETLFAARNFLAQLALSSLALLANLETLFAAREMLLAPLALFSLALLANFETLLAARQIILAPLALSSLALLANQEILFAPREMLLALPYILWRKYRECRRSQVSNEKVCVRPSLYYLYAWATQGHARTHASDATYHGGISTYCRTVNVPLYHHFYTVYTQ